MGVIQRQGIKHSIVNFTGLAIGTASTLFIYTQREVVEGYGLVQFLLSIAMVALPLFSLSSNTVSTRFFPRFEDKSRGHNGFLFLLLSMCFAGWSACLLIALAAWSPLESFLTRGSPLLRGYLWMALPLSLFYTIATVLYTYAANFRRIVIPSIILEFSIKLFLPVQMVAVWLGWISLQVAVGLLLVHYLLVVLGMMIYLKRLGEWHWRPHWAFLTPALRKEIVQYAGFGIINGFALLLATKADTLMVGSLTTIKNTGIYAIALNIAAAIEIPTKSVTGASLAFVARYLADENWTEMRILYQKVSINLLVAGFLLFGCVLLSADDLFALMPNSQEISQGKYVLLFLSLSKLVDMGTSLNNQLVYYSNFYRYSMVSLIILAIANIGFNFWFIPILGLTGAAVATLLSITFYNLFSLFLVWKKFRIQPFTPQTIRVLGVFLAGLAAVWWLPSSGLHLVDIVIRSGLYTVLFLGLVVLTGISPDINQLWADAKARIKHLRG